MSVLTLEEAAKKIEQWRQTKNSHRDPIPDYLWKAAINFSNTHGTKHVADIMKLSHSDLRKKLGIPPKTRNKTEKLVSFAKLPPRPKENKIVFELTTESGLILKVYR